jgi:hypothetical protein
VGTMGRRYDVPLDLPQINPRQRVENVFSTTPADNAAGMSEQIMLDFSRVSKDRMTKAATIRSGNIPPRNAGRERGTDTTDIEIGREGSLRTKPQQFRQKPTSFCAPADNRTGASGQISHAFRRPQKTACRKDQQFAGIPPPGSGRRTQKPLQRKHPRHDTGSSEIEYIRRASLRAKPQHFVRNAQNPFARSQENSPGTTVRSQHFSHNAPRKTFPEIQNHHQQIIASRRRHRCSTPVKHATPAEFALQENDPGNTNRTQFSCRSLSPPADWRQY